MTTEELRSRLGHVGIWMPPPERIGADPAATAAAIERAGFTSVWVGGGNPDQAAFTRLWAQLAGSERLIVGTGIANVWAWEPGELRAAAEALSADFPGRLPSAFPPCPHGRQGTTAGRRRLGKFLPS